MTTITIAAKGSNCGSIHDLNAEHCARVLNYGRDKQFAVIVAAYYNIRHSMHRTEAAAVRAAKALKGYSPTIINRDGDSLQLAYGELMRDQRTAFPLDGAP
jgi:hypothetical protein